MARVETMGGGGQGEGGAGAGRVGVWLIGGLGDVAVTAVLGAGALARGLAPTTGLVTARPPCEGLDLVPLDGLVFGGHDVREGTPLESARALAEAGVVPAALIEPLREHLLAYGQRLRPGVSFGAGALVRAQEGAAARARTADGPAAALEAIRADLRAFRAAERLERVVVVAVASTEPVGELPPAAESAEGLRGLIAAGHAGLPASLLYALAAAEEGCPYVNFTPSVGASPAGVQALFAARGVPHMGQDGKTGQTLLRTALAPMFLARNLKVLSWAGFNILGNRDGAVLDEPGANAAKTVGKDQVLGAILGPELGSSLTRIDYVPSLGDWKTAWDHVHFQGFLGARMKMEVTWHGCDSALAAPLVLDLVRLIELAARRGRSGLQTGLASFFKTPLGTREQALPAQLRLFEEWVQGLRAAPAAAPR